MGANVGTLVALDAGVVYPFRYHRGYPALLPLGSAAGQCAILTPHKGAHREVVALLVVHGHHHLVYKVWGIF